MARGRYVVPLSVARKNPKCTADILRLGALANAINAVTSMGASSISAGVGKARDTLQTTLLVVSYLKEAVDVLEHQRLWPLVQAAVDGGFQLPQPLDEY